MNDGVPRYSKLAATMELSSAHCSMQCVVWFPNLLADGDPV